MSVTCYGCYNSAFQSRENQLFGATKFTSSTAVIVLERFE